MSRYGFGMGNAGCCRGNSMKDRLENVRMFFPAEVTSSYIAIQGLLSANGIGRSEYMWYMATIAAALVVANIIIYWMFYNVRSIVLQIVLGAGFIIWVLNIDSARFKDFPILGEYLSITAPTLLIFYTLITSFIARPERINNAPSA
jgi:hypothetical protein